MSASALLSALAARDVTLYVREGALAWRAPIGTLTEEDRAALAEHRAELLELLQRSAPDAGPPLPLLALYLDAEGRPWESWLLPWHSPLLPCLQALGARATPVPGFSLTRADAPAGTAPPGLLSLVLAACPKTLEPPGADLLMRRQALACARGRPLLFHLLVAEELLLVAHPPATPPGLPDACPACRRPARWKALGAPGRFLCGRCWRPRDMESCDA